MTTTSPNKHGLPSNQWAFIPSGFALISTIFIMVLLLIIALAMMSLSSIEQRSSQTGRAIAEARANARMALMIAIGELQREMGPDQRISANADILSLDVSGNEVSVANPHYMGAWDSWIAGAIPSSVNDDYPSAASHHQTIGSPADNTMRPEYAQKEQHFRKWLVSLPEGQQEDLLAYNSIFTDASTNPSLTSDAVRIVGTGSLGTSSPAADFVNAPLVDIKSETDQLTGRYGWWVGDQGQKASILADPYNNGAALTAADQIHRAHAPGAMKTMMIEGFEDITDETELDKLPTHKTLELVNLDPAPAAGDPSLSQLNFHHASTQNYGVLSDVREGGLKRDLSTLLEREIDVTETGDPFMLYKFGSDGEDQVPIQDLSAYYQLYQHDPSWSDGKRGGIQHNAAASRVVQVNVPDYGDNNNRDKFTRQYTSLYTSPVPVKVQFVLGVGATNITQADRDYITGRGQAIRDSDKYKLLLGVKPVVSLWNPNNVPMVMGTNASQIMRVSFPPFSLRWKKYRAAADAPAEYVSQYLNLNYSISNESTGDGRARSLGPYIMKLQFARNTPIVFQPGEVKQFSVPVNAANFLENGGASTFGNNPSYQVEEFTPEGFYVTAKSAVHSRGLDVQQFPGGSYRFIYMVFGDNDKIDMEVLPEAQSPRARAVSNANEVRGSAFHFFLADASYPTSSASHFRNYQFISRFGGGDNPNSSPNYAFNNSLMLSGFPDGAVIPYEGETNAIEGSDIVDATTNGEAKALLNFSMTAACEKNYLNAGGAGAGRQVATRPFLHGSTLSAPQISDNSKSALYDYGWEWQVNKINELEEAFQDDGNSRGFYGGGYTIEDGATNVIQQYLPALPPISIASLSSAHLGGFSLANNTVMASPTSNVTVGSPWNNGPNIVRDAPAQGDFRQVTATGQGGLAPHTLQAIGNAYAHPNLEADEAFKTYTQILNMDIDVANPTERAYVDHSYLANKALWDEFCFTSITPQYASVPFQGTDKTATAVAQDFLFNGVSLPNRRLVPYNSNITSGDFDTMESEYDVFSDGFADKITAHMMLNGALNINSTSFDTWKVFFSSLKGEPLVYLKDQASSLDTTTSDDTPVAPGMLANGEPITSSELSVDANAPADQWTRSRSLTNTEIEKLAAAMVKQVKMRGPFLSLSEFVNRRLDAANTSFSVKGAIQAAIDDPDIVIDSMDASEIPGNPINAAFRTAGRLLDAEAASITAQFSEALLGPIAYGSTPYVDQADVLRHLGSAMSPRSDTFIVRAYGDSIDQNGDVQARVWCEAVVQRTPEYLDQSASTGDDAHTKQADLQSDANRVFGRKLEMVSFRWLNADEV